MHTIHNLGDLGDRSRDQGKLALIDLSGSSPREYSFAQLDEIANGVARGLLRKGIQRGERVAILSVNRVEFLAVLNGVMRAGMVAVPVNFKLAREQIDFILNDCEARMVFCDDQRRTDFSPGLPAVNFDVNGEFNDFLDIGPFATMVPESGKTAMVLYSSGTTGTPKGVILSHRSHIWVVQARMQNVDLSRNRYLIAAPLYHMNALALSQLAWAAHATIILQPRFVTGDYIRAIGTYRSNVLTAVPPMIAMMLADSHAMETADLSSVELVRMGSAPVSASITRGIRRVMPDVKIWNAYGTTEAGPVVFGPHPDGIRCPDLSVGYPDPRVQLRLASGADLDAGQGVLEIRSPAVMTGYLNRPELPPFTKDGFYITGDVFRRDENGFHYFVGRVDDMFVCGGENIYPGEVEKLLETHAAIAQACVVPIEDDIKGQKPVAFCVPIAGASPIADEVKRFALDRGPAYQHPRFVWFVERLPLTSTNKVDRKLLISRARELLQTKHGTNTK